MGNFRNCFHPCLKREASPVGTGWSGAGRHPLDNKQARGRFGGGVGEAEELDDDEMRGLRRTRGCESRSASGRRAEGRLTVTARPEVRGEHGLVDTGPAVRGCPSPFLLGWLLCWEQLGLAGEPGPSRQHPIPSQRSEQAKDVHEVERGRLHLHVVEPLDDREPGADGIAANLEPEPPSRERRETLSGTSPQTSLHSMRETPVGSHQSSCNHGAIGWEMMRWQGDDRWPHSSVGGEKCSLIMDPKALKTYKIADL